MQEAWYALIDDKQFGPLRRADLERLGNQGSLRDHDLVWGPGCTRWITVAEFRSAPVPSDASREITLSSADRILHPDVPVGPEKDLPDAPAPGAKRSNYFVRHWRGELSLPVSCWINGVLGSIVGTVVTTVIAVSTDLKDEFSPALALASLVAIWLVVVALGVWQAVGIWRSATRYRYVQSRRIWGGVAKFAIAAGVVQLIAEFIVSGGPQIAATYAIWMGDREVGKYAFRVLRGGEELEFSGGITFGAAKDFTQFLDAMGAVKVIHLDSPGGRVYEARRIAGIIRERGLSTYVSARCLSACTIIYMGGVERLISSGGRLGFHQPDFAGLTEDDRRGIVADQEHELVRLGVARDFARRVSLVVPQDMWFPTIPELLKAGVATRLVDAADFALSGPPPQISAEQLQESLIGLPFYQAVRRIDPEMYKKMFDVFERAAKQGAARADLRAELFPLVNQVFAKVLRYAPDDDLIMFARFQMHVAETLNRGDSSECYFSENVRMASADAQSAILNRHPELVNEQMQIEAKILQDYSGPNVAIPSEAQVAKPYQAATSSIKNLDLLDQARVPPSQYRQYCDTLLALYAGTLKLSKPEAATVLRFLFSPR